MIPIKMDMLPKGLRGFYCWLGIKFSKYDIGIAGYSILAIMFCICYINWWYNGFALYATPEFFSRYAFGIDRYFAIHRPGAVIYFFPGIIADFFLQSFRQVLKCWALIPSFLPFFYTCFVMFRVKPWTQRAVGLSFLLAGLPFGICAADQGGLASISFALYLVIHCSHINSSKMSKSAPLLLLAMGLMHEVAIIYSYLFTIILFLLREKLIVMNKKWYNHSLMWIVFFTGTSTIYSLFFSHKVAEFIDRNRIDDFKNIVLFNDYFSSFFYILVLFWIGFVAIRKFWFKVLFLFLYVVVFLKAQNDYKFTGIFEIKNVRYLLYCVSIVGYIFSYRYIDRKKVTSKILSIVIVLLYFLSILYMLRSVRSTYDRVVALYDARPAVCEEMSDQLLKDVVGSDFANIDQRSFPDYYLIYSERNGRNSKFPKILIPDAAIRDNGDDCLIFDAGKAKMLFGLKINSKALKYYPLNYFQKNWSDKRRERAFLFDLFAKGKDRKRD